MATTSTLSNDEPMAMAMATIILSSDEEPITFSQAMNLLSPHFVVRDELRQVLKDFATIPSNESTPPTYFATIPRDICNIILDFVPNLRQIHPEDPFEHIKSDYQVFVDKYIKPYADPRYDMANFGKLRQDFPIMFENSEIETEIGCFVKNMSSGLHICNPIDHARYAGNDTWVADISQQDRLFGNKNMKFLQFTDFDSGLAEIYILPSGLIFISTIKIHYDYTDPDADIDDDYLPNSSIRHDYLVDLANNRAIHITMDINRIPMSIMDDFGKLYIIPDDMVHVACWSHLTSDSLSLDFE